MVDLKRKSFADQFVNEIERAESSIVSQISKMESIFDTASNMLKLSNLQADSFNGSKSINNNSDNDETKVKYNFDRGTVKNLIKTVANYKKLINLQKNENNIISSHSNNSNQITTQNDDFENLRLSISNKNEYFKNYIPKLKFLLEKAKSMKDDFDILSGIESSSSDDEYENNSLDSSFGGMHESSHDS